MLCEAAGRARLADIELGETINPAPDALGDGSVLRRRVLGLDAYEVEGSDPLMRALLGHCGDALAGTDAWAVLEGAAERPRVLSTRAPQPGSRRARSASRVLPTERPAVCRAATKRAARRQGPALGGAP